MSSSIGYTGFLHGIALGRSTQFRPPWSLPERMFLALCTGCGGCRDECPRGLLQKGADGLPVIDFSQGSCDFCGDCVDACARGALAHRYQGMSWGPWHLKAHLDGDCLAGQGVVCRQCAEHCRAHAIHMKADVDGRLPSIDVQRCNGCGACFSSCPAGAISMSDGFSL